MAEHDDPRDPRVTEAYQGLGNENPPEAIDAAILAASRRAVGARPTVAGARARRWALPISIAAVVVLTMSLALRVQLERSDLESAEPTPSVSAVPPAARSPAADDKDAPRSAALESKEEMRATAKQNQPADALAKSKPAAAPSAAVESKPSVRGAGEREQSAPARKALKTPPMRTEAPQAAAPGFVPAPPAPAPSPAEPAAAPLGAAAASGAARPDVATGLARQMPAEADANAGRAASRMAVEDRVQPLAEKAGKADADLSPRDWLERIATLRRDGRAKAADESLAAFRRRYPDYEIPKELRDAVLGEAARTK